MRTYAVYYTENGRKDVMLIHGCSGQQDAITMFYTIKGMNAFIYDVRRQ